MKYSPTNQASTVNPFHIQPIPETQLIHIRRRRRKDQTRSTSLILRPRAILGRNSPKAAIHHAAASPRVVDSRKGDITRRLYERCTTRNRQHAAQQTREDRAGRSLFIASSAIDDGNHGRRPLDLDVQPASAVEDERGRSRSA